MTPCTKETKAKLIVETVNFYHKNNPRSVSPSGSCMYRFKDTDIMCAVGRCMTEKAIKHFAHKACSADNLGWSTSTLFIDKYSSVPIELWQELQELHDEDRCWSIESKETLLPVYSLNSAGIRRIQRIIDDFNLTHLIDIKSNTGVLQSISLSKI